MAETRMHRHCARCGTRCDPFYSSNNIPRMTLCVVCKKKYTCSICYIIQPLPVSFSIPIKVSFNNTIIWMKRCCSLCATDCTNFKECNTRVLTLQTSKPEFRILYVISCTRCHKRICSKCSDSPEVYDKETKECLKCRVPCLAYLCTSVLKKQASEESCLIEKHLLE